MSRPKPLVGPPEPLLVRRRSAAQHSGWWLEKLSPAAAGGLVVVLLFAVVLSSWFIATLLHYRDAAKRVAKRQEAALAGVEGRLATAQGLVSEQQAVLSRRQVAKVVTLEVEEQPQQIVEAVVEHSSIPSYGVWEVIPFYGDGVMAVARLSEVERVAAFSAENVNDRQRQSRDRLRQQGDVSPPLEQDGIKHLPGGIDTWDAPVENRVVVSRNASCTRYTPPAKLRPASVVHSGVGENGSYYGQISEHTGRPKTVHVKGYYRKDGTYVRSHYRSPPRRR